MQKIICPKCRCEMDVPTDKLGETVTCDSCKTVFVAGSSVRSGGFEDGVTVGDSAGPLSDGKFKEIEYKGISYSLQKIRQLNRRFCVFTSLFLLQIIFFFATFYYLWKSIPKMHGMNRLSEMGWLFVVPLILFVLGYFILFEAYVMLLKALQVSGSLFRWGQWLYLLVPIVFISACGMKEPFVVLVVVFFVVVFLADIIFRVFFTIKAARILNSAKEIPSEKNFFIRTMKRHSCGLILMAVSLFALIFFFGSEKNETGLCKNCGIWTDTDSVCFFGKRLLSFSSNYKPTAYSRFLDPEHQCFHHDGEVIRSEEERFLVEFLLSSKSSKKSFPHSINVRDPELQRKEEIRDNVKKYIENPVSIQPDSPLYRYLCEKNSKSLARRMIVFDLTSEEIEDIHLSLIGPLPGASVSASRSPGSRRSPRLASTSFPPAR